MVVAGNSSPALPCPLAPLPQQGLSLLGAAQVGRGWGYPALQRLNCLRLLQVTQLRETGLIEEQELPLALMKPGRDV